MRRVGVALIHHPVLGRGGEVLTTTITNLDLHDMSRCVRSYGLHAFYVVHPYESQRTLAERIQRHWVHGAGGKRIPDRAKALEVLRVVENFDAACKELSAGGPSAEPVEVWTTAAAAKGGEVTSYRDGRTRMSDGDAPVMLVFGTGWGLAPELLERADVRLEPISAQVDSGFNHLSVRAACAITLDRLLGPR